MHMNVVVVDAAGPVLPTAERPHVAVAMVRLTVTVLVRSVRALARVAVSVVMNHCLSVYHLRREQP